MQTLPPLPVPKYISNEVFLELICSTLGLTDLPVLRYRKLAVFKGLKSGSNFSFGHWQLCQPRVLLLPVRSSHDSVAVSV